MLPSPSSALGHSQTSSALKASPGHLDPSHKEGFPSSGSHTKGLPKKPPQVVHNLSCNKQSQAPFTNNAKEDLLEPSQLDQVLQGTICNKLKTQTKQS